MRQMIMAGIVTMSMCLGLGSYTRADDATKPIDVWPAGKAPGDSSSIAAEKWDKKKVTNVTRPTLKAYRPAPEADTGVAVIVCPGGGYKALMMDYEGEAAAHWLNSIGITGIVLKYRVPAPEGTPRWLPALQDAQRSISYVRSHAPEWKLNTSRIGIMGFSAGGHLSAAASTNFDSRAYPAVDDVDQTSCRPDFAIVIYPGGILERDKDGKTTGAISSEIKVTAQTPPAFLAMANDDRVNSENAVYYYLALKKAGVKADLHIYAAGGHGFGLKPSDKPCSTWPQRCEEWMHSTGILKPIPERVTTTVK